MGGGTGVLPTPKASQTLQSLIGFRSFHRETSQDLPNSLEFD